MLRVKAGRDVFFSGYNTEMDFFFPEDNLSRAVPEETRVTSLSAQNYPDGRRLRVHLEVTPFQKRPYIEVTLFDSEGDEIASTNIVEPLSWKLEFTMHVRGEIRNPYSLSAKLYYPDGPTAELVHARHQIEPSASEPD